MTASLSEVSATALRWLAAATFDGTVFALLCWVTSRTLLRRAGAQLLAVLWFGALLRFVVWGPLELHALPLEKALEATPQHPAARGALWLALAYAATLGAILVRVLLRQQRLRRHVATLPLASRSTIDSVQRAAQQLSRKTIPSVRVTPASVSPFSIGTLRPVLVLPQWLCEPGPRLHAVLLHELAHLQRRDQFTIWIERAVAWLFFFWPPVHWIARKLHDARELACDERAIERGGVGAPEYASHLLEVVARTRGSVTRDALAISHSAARLEQRIDWLLDEARPQQRFVAHAAVLGVLFAAALVAFRPQQAVPAALSGASLDVSQLSSFEEGGCDEIDSLQCGP